MPGRASKAYLMLPDEVLADEGRLEEMLAQAVGFTDSLPAKVKPVKTAKGRSPKP
jgi:hypothetical protein